MGKISRREQNGLRKAASAFIPGLAFLRPLSSPFEMLREPTQVVPQRREASPPTVAIRWSPEPAPSRGVGLGLATVPYVTSRLTPLRASPRVSRWLGVSRRLVRLVRWPSTSSSFQEAVAGLGSG